MQEINAVAVKSGLEKAANHSCIGSLWAYLGLMVTVNELLEIFVSVPPKVAEPVVENIPACCGTKFTVTSRVWPPGRLARLQVSVPPNEPDATPPHEPWLAAAETNWKLVGSGRLNATFGAAVLPVLFLICQVKASPVLTLGPPFCAEPFTWISALTVPPPPPPTPTTVGVVTFVVELATLFAAKVSLSKLPSASLNCTDAVFVSAVLAAATVTLMLALAPAFIAPSVQVKTAPMREHTPGVVVDDWNVPGNVSASVTSAALPGPLFVIVMVKVTNPPAFTLAGELIVMPRSVPVGAMGITVFDGADSALLPVALVAWTLKL